MQERTESGGRISVYKFDVVGFPSGMKAVRFVFEPMALPDLIVLCLGNVQIGDQLFNTLPTEQDAEPSFTVEKINGNIMTAKASNGKRGTLQFACLTEAQWNQRFND